MVAPGMVNGKSGIVNREWWIGLVGPMGLIEPIHDSLFTIHDLDYPHAGKI